METAVSPVIVHMAEKRYHGPLPLQGNCLLQLSLGCLLPWPLLSHDCLVSLDGNWDFSNQPVKVETTNNSMRKHLCKEGQVPPAEKSCARSSMSTVPYSLKRAAGITAITQILGNKQKDKMGS